VVEFWRAQRAAMHAMKVEGDVEKAIGLFRQALTLDPAHEDSLYYLGNCLAATGDIDGALERFDRLRQLNDMSHRAHKRWGTLRAMTARTPAELDQAEQALERAVSINPEATGALLVLGELDLLRGAFDGARRRLEWVGSTNPGSVPSHYLLGYLAWTEGRPKEARQRLERAREARGDDRTPEGATSEGDVRRRMHTDVTLLQPALDAWDGTTDPDDAFGALEALLDRSALAICTMK
jgi:tetratricopeptide (TPR) repeat protein